MWQTLLAVTVAATAAGIIMLAFDAAHGCARARRRRRGRRAQRRGEACEVRIVQMLINALGPDRVARTQKNGPGDGGVDALAMVNGRLVAIEIKARRAGIGAVLRICSAARARGAQQGWLIAKSFTKPGLGSAQRLGITCLTEAELENVLRGASEIRRTEAAVKASKAERRHARTHPERRDTQQ